MPFGQASGRCDTPEQEAVLVSTGLVATSGGEVRVAFLMCSEQTSERGDLPEHHAVTVHRAIGHSGG